jgi:hypothetical protein
VNSLTLGRWDWLLVSIALATLGSLIRWVVDRQAAARPTFAAHAWELLERLLNEPWLVQVLRVIYAVGLPAAALVGHRALSARGLGLKPLPASEAVPPLGWNLALPTWSDWARDLGTTVAIAAAVGTIIVLGDRGAARRHSTTPRADRTFSPLIALREAVIHQAHWAFYREPFVYASGAVLGPWLGALPVLVEMVLSPLFWERLRHGGVEASTSILIRAGIFVASTLVFLQTQNIWMALLLDLLVGSLTLSTRDRA